MDGPSKTSSISDEDIKALVSALVQAEVTNDKNKFSLKDLTVPAFYFAAFIPVIWSAFTIFHDIQNRLQRLETAIEFASTDRYRRIDAYRDCNRNQKDNPEIKFDCEKILENKASFRSYYETGSVKKGTEIK